MRTERERELLPPEPSRPFGMLLVTIAIFVSPGLTAFALRSSSVHYFFTNKLSGIEQYLSFLSALGSAALCLCFTLWVHHLQTPKVHLSETLRRMNRQLCFLPLLPLLAFLQADDAPFRYPTLTLAAIFLSGCVASFFLIRLLSAQKADTAPLLNDRIFLYLTTTLTLLVSLRLSLLAVSFHRNFGTLGFDTGIYTNIAYNFLHGRFLECSYFPGGSHTATKFDPLLALLTPIYRLAPRPETLLIFQSFWVCSGALPVYALTKQKLHSASAGLLLAAAFLLYPANHGLIINDFRSLPLSLPLLLWALYFLERKKIAVFLGVCALTLLVRDDISFLFLGIGSYLFSRGEKKLSVLIVVGAITYFIAVRLLFMPSTSIFMPNSPSSYSHANYFGRMIADPEDGALGLVKTVFSNPWYIILQALTAQKLIYFGLLLAPLLFLPLLAPGLALLCLYGLVFVLLSAKNEVPSIFYQYTTFFTPFLFALVPEGIQRCTALFRRYFLEGIGNVPALALHHALLGSLLCASALCSHYYGAFGRNPVVRERFMAAPITPWTPRWLRKPPTSESTARYSSLQKIAVLIPESSSVIATNRLAPHVSHRQYVYRFPHGGHDDAAAALAYLWPRSRNADYVLIAATELDKVGRRLLEELLAERKHVLVLKESDMYLYERIASAPQ